MTVPEGNQPGEVAVIGCGLIGESWSALYLAHGHDVVVWDPKAGNLTKMDERINHALVQLKELGRCSKSPGRITVSDSLERALDGATWIQENAPENVPLKRALYHDIESCISADTIVASSTSSLTWSELSREMRYPHRLITAHPFNPPHLMPLVEIYASEESVRERAHEFYRLLGRVTVTLKKDAVGHIANRLASALWREAVNIVAEGIADVGDVDDALVHGPGLRWSVVGSHMAYHLGGGQGGIAHYLAQLGASQERRWATLGSPELTPEVCEILVNGITEECAGRTVEELETLRDDLLINVLKARKRSVYDA